MPQVKPAANSPVDVPLPSPGDAEARREEAASDQQASHQVAGLEWELLESFGERIPGFDPPTI